MKLFNCVHLVFDLDLTRRYFFDQFIKFRILLYAFELSSLINFFAFGILNIFENSLEIISFKELVNIFIETKFHFLNIIINPGVLFEILIKIIVGFQFIKFIDLSLI